MLLEDCGMRALPIVGLNISDILDATKKTLAAAEETIEAVGMTSGDLNSLTDESSSFRRDLESAVKELGDAAGEISELAAYLSEHPNSIVFGRKKDPEDKEAADLEEKSRPVFRAGGRRR
jgi:hypothetical protein